jgi:hypothetical protein
VTDTLDAVIDAALERALLGADDARRYFALAGALERGRSAARPNPTHEHDDHPAAHPTGPGAPAGTLGAVLLSTAAIGALDAAERNGIDPNAWSPGDGGGSPTAEVVAAGAAAACRRFDITPEAVAARSGISPDRLARHRLDGSGADSE